MSAQEMPTIERITDNNGVSHPVAFVELFIQMGGKWVAQVNGLTVCVHRNEIVALERARAWAMHYYDKLGAATPTELCVFYPQKYQYLLHD